MLSWTKEGDVHLPVEMRPAPQTAGLYVERQRERGVSGSTGNWGVPSPPVFFIFFIPGFCAPSFRPLSCPIHTAGTITLPITPPAGPHDPALLTKRYSIGPLPLNLSAPALGEWLAAHKTEGWEKRSETIPLLSTFKCWKKYRSWVKHRSCL